MEILITVIDFSLIVDGLRKKRSPALKDDRTVKEAGLTNYVIAETLCKVGITSRRRSGWLGAGASGDAK
jgi:hypothetical protein